MDRSWLGVSIGIGTGLLFERGSEWNWFLWGGRKSLCVSVCTEHDLDYVGIKLGLISVYVSKLTWFLSRGRNRLGFSVEIETN